MQKFQCLIGQLFGANANPSYAGQGLVGHTGIDESCGYGSPIFSYVEGEVYTLYTPVKPANDGYTAIYLIVETPLEIFEFVYGHVSEINVAIGDHVAIGQKIGSEGNHGTVYSAGQQITVAMQNAGDHRGAHRHVQKRPLRKVARTTPGIPFLQGSRGVYQTKDGMYLEYALPYSNGFLSCENWNAPLFWRDLHIGMKGYDVVLLQRALGLTPDLQTGYFGSYTLRAVQDFQRKNNISPLFGYVGPKTRGVLNGLYDPLRAI